MGQDKRKGLERAGILLAEGAQRATKTASPNRRQENNMILLDLQIRYFLDARRSFKFSFETGADEVKSAFTRADILDSIDRQA